MRKKIYILILITSFAGMWGIFGKYTSVSGYVDVGYLLTTIVFSLLPLIFIGLLAFEKRIIRRFPGLIFFLPARNIEEKEWSEVASRFFDILGLIGILISLYLIIVENTAFYYIQRRDIPNPEYFITFAVITPMAIFALFLYMLYRLASSMED